MRSKKPVRKPAKGKPARKQKTVTNDETCLQMHCWAWITKAYPELLIFHVPNELLAHVSYHLKQKRLGKLNGVADFLIFPNSGRKIAAEAKDDKGVQEPDQIKFQKRWEKTGGTYHIFRTVEEFQRIVSAAVLFG